VPVISHSRVGRAVKLCQRPGHTASGPTNTSSPGRVRPFLQRMV
jgi:hypothetical protein